MKRINSSSPSSVLHAAAGSSGPGDGWRQIFREGSVLEYELQFGSSVQEVLWQMVQ